MPSTGRHDARCLAPQGVAELTGLCRGEAEGLATPNWEFHRCTKNVLASSNTNIVEKQRLCIDSLIALEKHATIMAIFV